MIPTILTPKKMIASATLSVIVIRCDAKQVAVISLGMAATKQVRIAPFR